ncbi:glycosyltransferase family 2 protein [Acetobacter orleanensis]|uniref:Glycosyl transferase n=1 Tax=Acetobacter orleanensis TaxID=104099 RepID=A0A4Y3TKK2_9PROT|nr:glycosyltransferase family 2 protein [Acetobacter orleanensis]KXV65215.1 glycosyltransferase [Acetobacter orleanensis]PCD79640.1 glycosyltransferase [Acetobacter orleanensis]GAN68742.1 glycosyl transferase [Acetobacter orleanensis JCM 7639]GBR24469.1 glycosyltransferase [Acetobacter orleanensis NRIC 0473]GEB82284.1 glycosyl transferase [Acetobacter orleanensis]
MLALPATPRNKPRLAIVVPCYNEDEVFAYCQRELSHLLDTMVQEQAVQPDSFLLFVDDGSRDATWAQIKNACAKNQHVQGLKLSRNVGHQSALLAGLETAVRQADAILSIDADLQDDIQAIPRMVEAYRAGYDVVYGVRESRQTDSWFKRATAESFYRLMTAMKVRQIPNHADFRLLSHRALTALLHYTERNTYLRGLVPLVGFPSTEISYTRGLRTAGVSKYPFRKMVALAVEGITSTTTAPLRLIAVLGLCICLLSLAAGLAVLVQKFNGATTAGWPSLILSVFFMGGVQMLSLGVIGEYIGKIYLETKHRPRFHVESFIGGTAD